MITAQQCATLAGLASNEVILGAPASTRHSASLSFYLQDLEPLDPQQVREIIVADIRVALSLGAVRQAADLMIVLRAVVFRISGSEPRRRVYAQRTTRSSPALSRRTVR